MPIAGRLAREREGAEALAHERLRIIARLSAAGGRDFRFLLEDCAELADMIEEMQDISSKRQEKAHAAFESKVKFSGRVRRKVKDIGRFEQKLVREYDQGHFTLEHGRRMVEIINLLRSNKADRAEQQAGEFYALLEMGERLRIIDEQISKKRAQAEAARRAALSQMEDLEWLEKEPAPDEKKIARHSEKARLDEGLQKMRLEFVRSLQRMPLAELLAKARADGLGRFGFPEISQGEADALAAFLRRSGLEGKTAEDLCELAGMNQQKLRHLGIDFADFRKEVLGRKALLERITALRSSGFMEDVSPGSPALVYLERQSEEASTAAERLRELALTGREDEAEWGRKKRIEAKKAGLSGVERQALAVLLHELEGMEAVLEGKMEPEKTEGTGTTGSSAFRPMGAPDNAAEKPKKGGKGLLDSVVSLFRGSR